MKLNDEDGFPHSEICGSKVAHTSPQLIAACHVLHRLCMPRHPPNALTSRLRIRTTNDNTDCIIRWSPCGGAVVISAFNCERQQLFAKNSRAATASILRTHSQCQRRPVSGPHRAFPHGSGLLHLEIKGWWSQSGSNRRPQACKASALPTELWPRRGTEAPREPWWAGEELNLRPHAYQACALTT
jgi:hypothetical protein